LKAVSAQQLDEATSNLERQRALVVRVKAQLDRIDVDLKKSQLFAPYAGTLAARMSDEGTVLASGQPVLEITETARTEIRIGFDRDLSSTLKPGTIIDASVRGLSMPLRIDRILPGRDKITRVVQFIATPIRPEIPLREADLVEVTLKQHIHQPGVWLPVSALTENARGLWSCLVAEPIADANASDGATHRLKRRDAQIESLEGERVYVSGHFKPGDQVVMDGVPRVVPNQRVRLGNGTLSAHLAATADRQGGILIMEPISKPTLATYMMHNWHLLFLTIVIILAGGVSALKSMPRLEDPIITNRNALSITLLPGASAERVEAQVTEIV
jgi:RND family efflux transporter MFP subunit